MASGSIRAPSPATDIKACRTCANARPPSGAPWPGSRATEVVMLTSYPDEDAVLSAIVAGASGYLLKQVRARDLVDALERVARGESLLDPAGTAAGLQHVRPFPNGAP